MFVSVLSLERISFVRCTKRFENLEKSFEIRLNIAENCKIIRVSVKSVREIVASKTVRVHVEPKRLILSKVIVPAASSKTIAILRNPLYLHGSTH